MQESIDISCIDNIRYNITHGNKHKQPYLTEPIALNITPQRVNNKDFCRFTQHA